MTDVFQTQADLAAEAVQTLSEIVAEMDKAVGALGDRYGAACTTGGVLLMAQALLALAEAHGLATDAKLCASILCRHHGVPDPYDAESLARAEELLGAKAEA